MPYVEDLRYEPMRPVSGEKLDQSSDNHKDLDSPKSWFSSEAIDGPVAHKKDNDKGTSVNACKHHL